ncbi:MAG: acyltransferase [Pseudomonadota bacterium]
MGKLKSIQSLRGIAALLVFLCHLFAIEQQAARRPDLLTSFWNNGAHGVDLFFVISGFVIVWVAADARTGCGPSMRFLYARAARIYPLWWLCAAAMAGAYWALSGMPWDAPRLAQYGMSGDDHLIRSFLLLPQAHHPVLGVGWTLVHEIYFYLVFALMILILPASTRLYGLTIWASVILIGSIAGGAKEFADSLIPLALHPMTLEFILGAYAAYLIKSGIQRFARMSLFVGLLGFAGAFWELDQVFLQGVDYVVYDMLAWRRTIVFGIPSVLIVYGLVALERQSRWRGKLLALFEKLGDWSYALYLCHSLVLAFTGRLIYQALGAEGPWAIGAYLAIGTATTLSVTALLHYSVERPSIAFFKRHRPTANRTLSQPG